MHYRRLYVPGATYFFTVVTADRRPLLCEPAALAALRHAIRAERQVRPFALEAMVVLPDHLHAVWRLPDGDADFSTRWRRIKARVTGALRSNLAPVWQNRFWEHLVRDERDLAAHLDYVHFNPVRHGFALHPAAWPWSSFHRHVRAGTCPADWADAPDLYVSHD